mgnify:CR=1 FL=1
MNKSKRVIASLRSDSGRTADELANLEIGMDNGGRRYNSALRNARSVVVLASTMPNLQQSKVWSFVRYI